MTMTEQSGLVERAQMWQEPKWATEATTDSCENWNIIDLVWNERKGGNVNWNEDIDTLSEGYRGECEILSAFRVSCANLTLNI